jgi:isoamylase
MALTRDGRTRRTHAAEGAMTTMLETEPMPSGPDAPKSASSSLGATPRGDGVNFSVFSKYATGVELLLFDRVDDPQAARVIRIDPAANRTYHYWHVFVPGLRPGQIYGYRVDGPFEPENGMRYDPGKVLLDPYGRGVVVTDSHGRMDPPKISLTIKGLTPG